MVTIEGEGAPPDFLGELFRKKKKKNKSSSISKPRFLAHLMNLITLLIVAPFLLPKIQWGYGCHGFRFITAPCPCPEFLWNHRGIAYPMENHHFFMGKLTISMVMFHSKLLNYKRITYDSPTTSSNGVLSSNIMIAQASGVWGITNGSHTKTPDDNNHN